MSVNRLENQRKAYQTFDSTLEACEKTIYDLDSQLPQKFSAIGSSGEEIKKQLDDLKVRFL